MFCLLSPEAKALYCPLAFGADAKGIVSYHDLVVIYKAPLTALQELEEQGFLFLFPEQEVAVVVHYPLLNPVRGKTLYPSIFKKVKINNGYYSRIG